MSWEIINNAAFTSVRKKIAIEYINLDCLETLPHALLLIDSWDTPADSTWVFLDLQGWERVVLTQRLFFDFSPARMQGYKLVPYCISMYLLTKLKENLLFLLVYLIRKNAIFSWRPFIN